MEQHRLESLSSRPAAHRRMRRRWPWLRVAILATCAFLGTLLGTGGLSGIRHARLAQPPSRSMLLAGPAAGRVHHQAAFPGSSLWSQVAAVRRLAAAGLPLYCGGRAKRVVALTFDDGPGPYTRLAVKKLGQFGLHATFFLVGKELGAWPGRVALERSVALFGDHTMTHPFLPALGHARMVWQITRAEALIRSVTGEPVVLFRPPYEGHTRRIDAEVRALGMLEVLWNVDSQDSLGASYAGIERNVIAGLKPGSIILMHENHGQTIRALPTIFAALRRDRLQAVTVPELVAEDPPSRAQLRAGVGGCGASRRRGNGG